MCFNPVYILYNCRKRFYHLYVCRHNDFHAIDFVLVDRNIWNCKTMVIGTELWYWFGDCSPIYFQTMGLTKKGVFLVDFLHQLCLVLWCLMPLSTICQLYRGSSISCGFCIKLDAVKLVEGSLHWLAVNVSCSSGIGSPLFSL